MNSGQIGDFAESRDEPSLDPIVVHRDFVSSNVGWALRTTAGDAVKGKQVVFRAQSEIIEL